MTTTTLVDFFLVGDNEDGRGSLILRRDTDEKRIQPTARTRKAWAILMVKRRVRTETVQVVKAWRKGVEADD